MTTFRHDRTHFSCHYFVFLPLARRIIAFLQHLGGLGLFNTSYTITFRYQSTAIFAVRNFRETTVNINTREDRYESRSIKGCAVQEREVRLRKVSVVFLYLWALAPFM